MLGGDLRAKLVSDLGDAYCEELERTGIGPFDRDDADPERIVPVAQALDFLPERALEPEDAERAAHGVAVAAGDGRRETRPDHVRLTHQGTLVAIAEPRGDELKPVVVFEP